MKKFKGKTLQLKEGAFHFIPGINGFIRHLTIVKNGRCILVISADSLLKIELFMNGLFRKENGPKKKSKHPPSFLDEVKKVTGGKGL